MSHILISRNVEHYSITADTSDTSDDTDTTAQVTVRWWSNVVICDLPCDKLHVTYYQDTRSACTGHPLYQWSLLLQNIIVIVYLACLFIFSQYSAITDLHSAHHYYASYRINPTLLFSLKLQMELVCSVIIMQHKF